jgi:UDP-N-acetylmuramoylalanine--D-glutamate ligase
MSQERNTTLAHRAVWDDLTGASFTVVGLGKSGVSAANALVKRGADVLAIDDQPAEKLAQSLASLDQRVVVQVGLGGTGPIGRGGDLFVVSPGLMPHTPRYKGIAALASAVVSEVELFYRLDRAANQGAGHPIAAITGTDGKTTTTLWVAHLLREAGHTVVVGGNIGDPLCDFLDSMGPDDVVVAEISAFQLYACSLFRPRVAVVTNVAEDHMDWFGGDFAAYVAQKVSVGRSMGFGDTFLINADDADLEPHRAAQDSRKLNFLPFSVRGVPDVGLGYDGERLLLSLAGNAHVELGWFSELGRLGKAPILGIHNVENALAACGLAIGLGAPLSAIRRGLQTFSLPSHRLEPAGSIGQVRFVDDSKATNPHAAIAGLEAMTLSPGEKLVWIGGGSEKDSEFGELGDVVGQRAAHALLIGQTAERIAQTLPAGLPVERCASMQEAVARGLQLASPAGIVLLSPACASFDMFKSYAHRGDVFQEAVTALALATQK